MEGVRLAVTHGRAVPCGQFMLENPRHLRDLPSTPSSSLRTRGGARAGRSAALTASIFSRTLEYDLQRKLQQPRIAHLLRLTEGRAGVAGVSVDAVELRVVKHVVNFRPEFETQLFPNRKSLENAHVP